MFLEGVNMMNNSMIVGRIKEIKKYEQNTIVKVEVVRTFKNTNNEYETDIIPCVLFGEISDTTLQYCKIGDVIGIKGRLQNNDDELLLIAEKVSFISSKNSDND